MKNTLLVFLFSFITLPLFSQIGINTTNPTSDLDVNGTIRVRNTKSTNDRPMQAVKVLGLDKHGNFVEVELDNNLYLENNTIKYSSRQESVYNRPVFTGTGPSVSDVTGIIWPGGTGNNKPVIKITTTFGDIEITGIDMSGFATPMDAHGYVVTMYSTSGELKLKSEDSNSQTINQFLLADGNDVNLKQYEMVKIMYDGELERWLVFSKH